MSDQTDSTPTTVAETDLLRGLARLEKAVDAGRTARPERVSKAQITGKLPGNAGPKGTWSEGKEPTEVGDEDADVSTDSREEERDGEKSDTDYKPKTSPVRKAMGGDDPDDTDGDGDGAAAGDDDPDDDDDPFPDEDEDEGDDDKKDDADKSFASRVRRSRHIKSGVEVSPFLRDLVRSLNKSQRVLERRIVRALSAHVDRSASRQRAFNRSLTEVLSGLSAVALEQGDLLKALSAQPARGPKSQTRAVRPIQKSFEGGEEPGTIQLVDGSTLPQLAPPVVGQRLAKAVHLGILPAIEVVKYETTGVIHPTSYRVLVTDERLTR